jgi:hypothetical protein
MILLMPKKKQPEPHQLAAIFLAKATGTPVPERAKEFAHLVKKAPRKSPKKR